jgi:hypothetical protein
LGNAAGSRVSKKGNRVQTYLPLAGGIFPERGMNELRRFGTILSTIQIGGPKMNGIIRAAIATALAAAGAYAEEIDYPAHS